MYHHWTPTTPSLLFVTTLSLSLSHFTDDEAETPEMLDHVLQVNQLYVMKLKFILLFLWVWKLSVSKSWSTNSNLNVCILLKENSSIFTLNNSSDDLLAFYFQSQFSCTTLISQQSGVLVVRTVAIFILQMKRQVHWGLRSDPSPHRQPAPRPVFLTLRYLDFMAIDQKAYFLPSRTQTKHFLYFIKESLPIVQVGCS